MTDTSGEINLQSKQNIIYRVTKVKSATSAHYKADVLSGAIIVRPRLWLLVLSFFSARNIPFESNTSIKPKNCILHTIKKNNIHNIFRVLMCQQFLAYKHHRFRDSMSGPGEFGTGHRQN